MAVVNTKTASVTARDATPNTLTNYRGNLKVDGGTVAIAAADDDTSVYRVLRLASNARIFGVEVTNGTVTGGTDYDFGVYQTPANGGAVVDADCIVDGATHATARLIPTALAFQAGNSYGKYLWEIIGLSADPVREYDLCWTANTVGSGATDLTTYVYFTA